MAPVAQSIAAGWWDYRPDVLRRLEGDSLTIDHSIARLSPLDLLGQPDLRATVERSRFPIEHILAYVAASDGPYGRYRLAALFFGPPSLNEPMVVCLDGPRGRAASEHRNGSIALCLYYPTDPPERRWTLDQGLARLFDLARQHLLCEYLVQIGQTWPIEEAPHGATQPAPRDPARALAQPRHPGRNDRCPCGSGRKAKRCCFR